MLGSLNLSAFVKEGKFNEESFKDAVRVAVDCLNEVLEEGLPLHPLQEQRDAVAKWRQIGLGIFGLADCLIKMQITYGSEKAQEFCRYIGRVMINSALQESAELAGKYGTYPEYNELVLESPFFKHVADIETIEKVKKYGLRNSQLLTIPPAGTISSLIGVSSGAEPIFANHYTRKTESLHNEEYYYKIYTPIVADYMKNHNILEEEDLPEWFVTAKDIKPLDRVKMQGALQEFIDASISSTINLPYEATEEEVQEIYYSAWKEHLKGVTIYRAGCKREGVLVEENKPKEEVKKPEFVAPTKQIANTLPRGAIIECSNDLIGKKRRLMTGCGGLHVLAYFDPVTGDLQEVFLARGSTGGCSLYMNGLSRCISLLCRAGVDIYTIKDQLDSTGTCPSYNARRITKHDTSKGACCPMAVGNALLEMYQEMQSEIEDDDIEDDDSDFTEITKPVIKEVKEVKKELAKVENKTEPYQVMGLKCPECGEPLVFEGGCNSCKNCGYSKCE